MKTPATGADSSLKFRFEAASNAQDTVVVLSGALDENADVKGLFAQLTGDAVLNMRNVERVNSMGVHLWVPLVNKYAAQHKLAFEEISYALVQNANTVANMFGQAQIRSCMAPYYCLSCNDNVTVPVSSDEVAKAGSAPPTRLCGRCRAPMEFDELDGYFDFFKRRSK